MEVGAPIRVPEGINPKPGSVGGTERENGDVGEGVTNSVAGFMPESYR